MQFLLTFEKKITHEGAVYKPGDGLTDIVCDFKGMTECHERDLHRFREDGYQIDIRCETPVSTSS